MTSLSSLGVDALLRAAKFLENIHGSDQLDDVLQETETTPKLKGKYDLKFSSS